jgi:putative salt-induced outer membrane protein YdiY
MRATMNRTAPRFTVMVAFCALWHIALATALSHDTFAQESLEGPTLAEPPSSKWTPPGGSAYEELPAPGLDVDSDVPSDVEGDVPVDDDWVLSDDALLHSPTWYEPGNWIDPEPWDAGIELGLNGSSGTSESFSIRTGGYAKLDSRFAKLDFSLYYNRTSAGGVTTQDNAQMDVRNDWLLDESSPWTLYALGSVFYDNFQDFDVQSNANSGVGYKIADFPDLTLMTRVGAGASREFGGVDDEWTPEALFGFNYEQKVTQMQKFACNLEYYPEFEEFGRYRLVTDAGYEIALDKPSNLSLKFSVNDRYDSTPNGAEPHLVNYSALIILKL